MVILSLDSISIIIPVIELDFNCSLRILCENPFPISGQLPKSYGFNRFRSEFQKRRDYFLYSKLYSAALAGMDCFLVQVETDVSDGLPHVEMVGALSPEAREARERVRTAIKNAGIRIPPKRITINLSPADRRKEGTGFDLAIAAGIFLALELAPAAALRDAMIVGEVSVGWYSTGNPWCFSDGGSRQKIGDEEALCTRGKCGRRSGYWRT